MPDTSPDGVSADGDEAITWLSTAEAARRLGVTPRTLYRFIDEGQLPAYRFGRVIRLQAVEVDAYSDSCRKPSPFPTTRREVP